jgi:nitrite reductase (NADH) large subunit
VREAIAAGAVSLEALALATRAGTGCGSCKTELAQILKRTATAADLTIAAVG